ncbi:MAG TPA: prolyl oligopeptidase family serine peptidase [Ktedonobacterales bacterium]|jgi:pimeloyl-ACP methyl ester carboxylesterase
MTISIESLLAARLFVAPKLLGDRIFFLSNLGQGGHLSLYAMDVGGSVPEPLLPARIAVQNPELIGGESFALFPKLGKILLMLDRDGDENYQPMLIPIEGGIPEPAFGDTFANHRMNCLHTDPERNLAYLNGDARGERMYTSFQVNLETGSIVKLGQNAWGSYADGINKDHTRVIMQDGYSVGDIVLYEWQAGWTERKLLYGIPLEQRAEGQEVPLNSINSIHFSQSEKGLLFITSLFTDTYSLGYLNLSDPTEVKPIIITGTEHTGMGELIKFRHLDGDRFAVEYNIDGCSWLYEGAFDEASLTLRLEHVLCGKGKLSNGMLESFSYDKTGNRFALSFSTATSPSQIYTIEDGKRHTVRPPEGGRQHTRERVLGISQEWLSPGEDASFTSFDGLRTSARLYLPAPALGFEGPRPLVYYIHGGPQGQERPDFTWFSMPLIQYLTLNGFAVFVPNVRGSTGYGLSYTKWVDHDWGGKDRLDHVHAMTKVLPHDKRVDVKRAGVMGRSYGGYMTLTQATRHPELWSAAIDMFGPYDLITFSQRIPESWKPYFELVIGHPERDRDFLVERSPRTYMNQITCPMLVIQGKNDPRVVERESRDVVEQLQAAGKQADILVFEDEGHDVLKYANRVTCYTTITEFFKKHLM